jgi:hypothetical protein
MDGTNSSSSRSSRSTMVDARRHQARSEGDLSPPRRSVGPFDEIVGDRPRRPAALGPHDPLPLAAQRLAGEGLRVRHARRPRVARQGRAVPARRKGLNPREFCSTRTSALEPEAVLATAADIDRPAVGAAAMVDEFGSAAVDRDPRAQDPRSSRCPIALQGIEPGEAVPGSARRGREGETTSAPSGTAPRRRRARGRPREEAGARP